MTQIDPSNNSLSRAFDALQTALVSLEQVVEEQAEKIALSEEKPDSSDTEAKGQHTLQMSMDEKQAVQHELARLKETISAASALVLNAQKSGGTS